jgi:serine acetyltransferase
MSNKIVFKLLLLWYIYLFFKNILQLFAKIELPSTCRIGESFNIVHPYGLVMGNKVQIGDNCTIGPWVVFGHNGVPEEQPIIGNNVYIGAHSCILGKVKIGDNTLIGVNTVVTRDVPANSTVKAIFEITVKK